MLRRWRALRARVLQAAARAGDALDLQDAFVFGGLACVGVGLWQVYAPLAWIVVGAALFWLGTRSG